MKKGLLLLLTLMLVCAGMTAVAEETTIEITYDGTYVESEEYGFKVYLPSEWNVYEDDDYYLYVGNVEETQYMAIQVFEAEGEELMSIAEDVAADEGIGGVAAMTINGIPFVLYEAPDQNFFGAFTNTEDNVYCIHFIFTPYDEEFTDLATQIMASVSAL